MAANELEILPILKRNHDRWLQINKVLLLLIKQQGVTNVAAVGVLRFRYRQNLS